jgi:hypothetical protein
MDESKYELYIKNTYKCILGLEYENYIEITV